MQHTKRAFTLLELLTVVGIIALLAAVLLPTLNRARGRGRQTACVAHLHQLGLAVNLYADDHRHHLPVAALQPSVDTNGWPSIRALLQPYVGANHAAVFQCPSDTEPLDAGQTFSTVEGASYGWNYLLNGRLIDRAQIDLAALALWPPVLSDYEKFHGAGDSGRNHLYPDGRVERGLQALNP